LCPSRRAWRSEISSTFFARFFLRQNHGAACAVGEPFEHDELSSDQGYCLGPEPLPG
jgi:hypothetical protein